MIALNGNLTFQSDAGEIKMYSEEGVLDISFSNWKVFHLLMKSGDVSYSDTKRYLKEISHPVTISIDDRKLVVLKKGRVKSFNIGRLMKLYWTKYRS